MSDFIGFPTSEEILKSLRSIDQGEPWQEELYSAIAHRLGSRVYDGAACTFILMEVLHEFEETHGQDLRRLLAMCIVALTQDKQLADSAVETFDEIQKIIRKPDDGPLSES
jgi:hypothetical protein